MKFKDIMINEDEQLNGYIGIYKGKKFETHAKTSYEAQKK